jgi:hypothetical protein
LGRLYSRRCLPHSKPAISPEGCTQSK